MDGNNSNYDPDAGRLRALLLSLRYCYRASKEVKSNLLGLLISNHNASHGQLVENIYRKLMDSKSIDKMELATHVKKSMDTIAKLHDIDIHVLMIPDEAYPSRFKEISDAPFVIMAKGNIKALNPDKSIAVIGTREVAKEIYDSGIEFSMHLSQNGWMIVSGLARGCDSAGHIGCLKGQGITTAILPSSIEKIYPTDNKQLAVDIAEGNGCLISEYLSSERIQKYFFVQRDRLQAALSDHVLVLQTGIKGGTMHTVKFAQRYGKSVIAYLPGSFMQSNVDITGNRHLVDTKVATMFDDIDSLNTVLEHSEPGKKSTQGKARKPKTKSKTKKTTKKKDDDQLLIQGIGEQE